MCSTLRQLVYTVFVLSMLVFGERALAIDRELARVIHQVFVNETNYKFVMNAKTASACLLEPARKRIAFDTSPMTYKEGEPVEISPELLAELKAELKNPTAYSVVTVAEKRKSGYGGSGCLPLYAVRLHFKSDGAELGVNFCFGCGDIALSRGEKIFHGAGVLRRDARFLDLCLKSFPDDEGLRKVKAQWDANAAAAAEKVGEEK